MGVTKTAVFSESLNRNALFFKALGHPARLAIVFYLLHAKQCVCKDLVDELPLAQATISQHLKELKSAGIIKGTVDGNTLCYCIDAAVWVELAAFFQSHLQHLACNNDTANCC